MAKDLTLKHHRGMSSDVDETLRKPISQELLNRDLTRLAYVAKDGTPRVVCVKSTWAKFIDLQEALPPAEEELTRRREERQ